jgi:ubiquinone/menaquinone biosynthesis C-methylase UbiE
MSGCGTGSGTLKSVCSSVPGDAGFDPVAEVMSPVGPQVSDVPPASHEGECTTIVKATRDDRQAFFDETAATWEDNYDHSDLRGELVRARMRRCVAALAEERLPPGAMVLDAGAGPGVVADRVAAMGASVCAVDFSLTLLRRAQQRFREQRREHAYVIQADAHQLPFKDGAFAAALAIALVGWVRDPPQVVRELARVVGPGAVVMFTVRNLFYCGDVTDPMAWFRLVVPKRIRRWLRGAPAQRDTLWSEVMCFRIGRFNALLRLGGFRVDDWRTLQYGNFQFLGRSILPVRWQLACNRALERVWRLPIIRRVGWTYYVKAIRV